MLSQKFKNKPHLNAVREEELDVLEIAGITGIEVLKLIDTISICKSSGMDDVSSKVIKDFMTILVHEFTFLYNRILESGIFPDRWKIVPVTPIPKVTNATNPTDLRPISLSIPGKLLTKMSSPSTNTNFLDDIILNTKTSIVAYLDFQKAFDMIDHDISLA